MAILINFKICDNAKECNGVAVCKTGALFWDDEKKTLKIDNSKCINCGQCEKACMVDAIKVAKNEAEHKKYKKEIDEDQRNITDLFIDRYGAQPIHPAFLINEDKFDLEILESNKLAVVELFNEGSVMCLLKSIPIKGLFGGKDIKYRKLEIKNDSLLKKYKIKELPSLLFFKSGKLIGKVEGYYGNKQKKEILSQISKIKI